jgi:hypothetical protein
MHICTGRIPEVPLFHEAGPKVVGGSSDGGGKAERDIIWLFAKVSQVSADSASSGDWDGITSTVLSPGQG